MRGEGSVAGPVQLLETIRRAGFAIEPGLTNEELEAVEGRGGFRFPPDLRALLADGLPRGRGFPDWRSPGIDLDQRLEAPRHGLVFHVETDAFWLDTWGPRPADVVRAVEVAAARLAGVPALVPVYLHRYLPTEPCEAGNPVLSVMASDIIVYGRDLARYIAREFGSAPAFGSTGRTRPVPFWSDLVS